MRTVILEEPGRFAAADTPEPSEVPPGHALVAVRRVGICGTDLHAFRGVQPFFSYPRILGHELGVEVLEVNAPGSPLRPGMRCAVEPYLNCGTCIACRHDKPNCCTHLRVLGVSTDGGMRERIVMPLEKLHPSDSLGLEQLALVETLGIGCHAVDRARVSAGETVLVIGAGPIGLTVVQFALAAGATVTVMDINPQRLAFCRNVMGVAQTIDARDRALEQLQELHAGELPLVVFDATGHAGSMMQSFEYIAPGGRLVFVGLFQGDVTFNDPHFHRREITLLASRNSRPQDFRKIIPLLENGTIDTQPWITHRAGLAEMIDRFPGWLDPEAGVLKAVVEI